MQDKLFKIEHNVETGEIKEIPLTPEEILELEKNQAKIETELQTETAKAAEKQAILDKLGITAEQAKLLLS